MSQVTPTPNASHEGDDEQSALLEFIYLSPFALARIDGTGAIEMMNAVGAQLLMEFALDPCLTNLFDVFDPFAPELRRMAEAFTEERGPICDGYRVAVPDTMRDVPMVLAVTLLKLNPKRIMVAINDISKLEAANRARGVLLDNVSDGLVTLDAQGHMAGECSAALVRWLGRPTEGTAFWDYVHDADPRFAVSFEGAWEQLREGFLPLELCIEQLPHRIHTAERPLGVTYTPLLVNGELTSVMVVLRDITSELERERLESEQRDLLAALNRMSTDRQGFQDFVAESTRLVESVIEGRGSTTQLARDVHTLKGNSGIYGLTSVSQLCHQIEDHLRDQGGVMGDEDRAELRERWQAFSGRLQTLLGDTREQAITLRHEEYEALVRAVRRGTSHERLARMLSRIELTPVGPRLERFAAQIRDLATRLEKAPVEVVIEGAHVLHDGARFTAFWSAFAHAVRNAVDHGIETPDQRAALGKGPAQIHIAAESSARGLVITISDNGRGIAWDRVAKRAAEHGLPSHSKRDLVEALFTDGLSTAEAVTDVSGRGVGMGALRAACSALGGTVTVFSRPGRGTTFRFVLPAAAAPSPKPSATTASVRTANASVRTPTPARHVHHRHTVRVGAMPSEPPTH